jgi:CheY-like chemotaxis protein
LAVFRVLIVEDHDDTRELLREMFASMQAVVVAVPTAAAALTFLEEAPFDLVLSDIGLPEMDGFELAERLRTHPRRAEMQVVAVSGFADYRDRATESNSGFDAFVSKPVLPETLAEMLSSHSK